jgi:hypothetical protein
MIFLVFVCLIGEITGMSHQTSIKYDISEILSLMSLSRKLTKPNFLFALHHNV